jgi:primosomal protein N' (replication factor Y)
MEKAVSVILSNSLRSFDKEYTYLIDDELYVKIYLGCRVIVPFGFGNRNIEGFIVDIIDNYDLTKINYKLKKIKEVLFNLPSINKEFIWILKWMKIRYVCTYYEIIKCMIPPGSSVKTIKFIKLVNYDVKEYSNTDEKLIVEFLKENKNIVELEFLKSKLNINNIDNLIQNLINRNELEFTEDYKSKVKEKYQKYVWLKEDREKVLNDIENNNFKRIQHIKILELLMDVDIILQSDLLKYLGVSVSNVNTLKKNNYIEVEKLEVLRDPFENSAVEKSFHLILNEEQEFVYNEIVKDINKEKFCEGLLYGITGSGKTEVYLQLIQKVIDIDKTAILLVPEISLTPQIVNRFKSRFGDYVAVLHSGLSIGERYDQWKLIKDNKVKIVVGARSAIFAPLDNIGIIIIDEEHESSYKSDSAPRYHAKEVAKMRCKLNNAYLLSGSATPSMESYYSVSLDKIKLYKLTSRANKMSLPKVKLIDMRNELENGNRSMFSYELENEIMKNLENKQQTMLFINRRGYASFILCRECGYKIDCDYCNITMTYHLGDNRLICHYCGFTKRKPTVCPECNSKKIREFGVGTQRIVSELEKKFKNASLIRMDSDITGYKNSHQKILDKFVNEKIDILVGTQMIAKGHDFPNVTLVGVLAADSLLETGDFRSTERTFQLLTQVTGRAGRGEILGRAVIQGYNIDNYSIESAKNQNYLEFYEKEIKLREMMKYPPFKGIAIITLKGFNDDKVYNAISNINNLVNENINKGKNNTETNGPLRNPIARIKEKYRWRIILKYDNLNFIVRLLNFISDWYYKAYKKSDITLIIDINPYSML